MDVFFCGFGCWNGVTSSPESILSYDRLTDTYQVNRGAFSLRKKDELVCNYNETGRFDGIQYLQPSARSDDEFRKAQRDKVLVLDKAYGKYKGYIFSIDASRQAELVIAEPDKPPQAKTNEINVAKATKQRKKKKPLQREANVGLLLVYKLIEFYNVEYLDELPAVKAWGKIVSKEFTCDLIKSISDSKKSITLSGDENLTKIDFSDKYRRRFE
jgi:hypothetical protein